MSGDTPEVEVLISLDPEVRRRILWIQGLTIVWMTVEAALALASAWRARSPALLGFGGDSLIELVSAATVFWRFRVPRAGGRIEERSARIAGVLLFVLAAFVASASGASVLGYSEVHSSLVGMALLLAAAFVMPWLARQKRRLSAITSSAALRADAAESSVCGYMAWIALVGQLLNAVWKVGWADPVTGLCLIPIILHEGAETIKGKPCQSC
jgi:divalent metal cation (Fe/Co/Zn/Cd) transporter